ncbi:hypothetical protein [Streptomyces spectabilis]|uniref:Uncharacterized protein n=1 Tax=Streptomyces spectabilis TaxID=68270 RepID=A0A516R2E5_STRST|nr:hypothetical protein [Streptomyces spectabilis]QDQ09827.1 hypothetical protein FH965_04010 [Streptomyces spectabilis]
MSSSRRRTAAPPARGTLERTEATLVDRYAHLVRLAYLTLPPELGRHRKVLVAQALVQRALPSLPRVPAGALLPRQRTDATPAEAEEDWLRARVLRSALAYDRRPRGWPARVPPPRALRPRLPVVWGLRLSPHAGGAEEIALSRALAAAPPAARAVLALRCVDDMPDERARELLLAVGEEDPDTALATADALRAHAGADAAALLRSAEFDACSVRTRPTDLLRRRRRVRLAGLVAAVTACGTVLAVSSTPTGPPDDSRARPVRAAQVTPAQLVHTASGSWADTARVDFTAWPARGGRTDDDALLGRALDTWAAPPPGTSVTRARTTDLLPPTRGAQLLYAGDVDGRAVVLLHDSDRVVRYSEPLGSPDRPALEVARTDEAGVTTAAALVVARHDGAVRYLAAPWIADAQTRDLLRPDTPGRPLHTTKDGITDLVDGPAATGACTGLPVLQLRSSVRIVEKHAFLVTDLGGLTPAHLTHTPSPHTGAPARQPREATGPAALTAWARTACALRGLRDHGVRAVNLWDFAEQDLPERGGRAVWSCTRVSTWAGSGDIQVHLRPPARSATAPARLVARDRSTAACSRFGQHIVARAAWTTAAGRRYLLAAGSRDIRELTVTGDARATEDGNTLAVRVPKDAAVSVRGRTEDGANLRAVGGPREP